MNTQNNENNKSFAEILLQAALHNSAQRKEREEKKESAKSFAFLIGYAVGFFAYCGMLYLGYSVISSKFSLVQMSFIDCVQICLGFVAIKKFLFQRH
jgi:hypothetical protein